MKRKIIKISSALVLLIVLLTSTMIPALADSRDDYAYYPKFIGISWIDGEADNWAYYSNSVKLINKTDTMAVVGVPEDFTCQEALYVQFGVILASNQLGFSFFHEGKRIFTSVGNYLMVAGQDNYIYFPDNQTEVLFDFYLIPVLDSAFLFLNFNEQILYFELSLPDIDDTASYNSEVYFAVTASESASSYSEGTSIYFADFVCTELPVMTAYMSVAGYNVVRNPEGFLGPYIEEAYQNGFFDGGTLGYEEGYADGLAAGSASGGGNTDGSYDEGYAAGKTDGFNEGYAAGRTEGQVIGQDVGYTAGLAAGKELGYADGKADGLANLESEKQNSYNEGKADGIDEGYADGKADGLANLETEKQNSYNEGKADGIDEGYADGKADGLADLEKQKKDAYDDGFYDGYGVGEDHGSKRGYNDGYEAGEEVGYANGFAAGSYDNGYTDGYADGYDVGHVDGAVDGYSSAYNDGYVDGKYTGDLEGYNRGHDEGYNSGYYTGMDDAAEIYYNQIYQDALDKIDENQGTGVQGFLAGMWAGTQGFVQEILDGITFSGLSLRSIVTTFFALALAAFVIRMLKG